MDRRAWAPLYKVEDHVDSSDISDYVERGVFQFHSPKSAAASRLWQVTAPFEDGLLSLKRAIDRRNAGVSSRFDLPPSIVDHIDTLQTLQFAAVGGGGGGGGWGRGVNLLNSSPYLV